MPDTPRFLKDAVRCALCDGTGYLPAIQPQTQRPEETIVLRACERWGFGAVMQTAADLWAQRDPVGALTVGTCRVDTLDALTPEHIEALSVAVFAIRWFGEPTKSGKPQPESHVRTHLLANEALEILRENIFPSQDGSP